MRGRMHKMKKKNQVEAVDGVVTAPKQKKQIKKLIKILLYKEWELQMK